MSDLVGNDIFSAVVSSLKLLGGKTVTETEMVKRIRISNMAAFVHFSLMSMEKKCASTFYFSKVRYLDTVIKGQLTHIKIMYAAANWH